MENLLMQCALIATLLPLLGAIIAGIFGKKLGHRWVHRVTISGVGIAFFLACYLFKQIVIKHQPPLEMSFYTFATAGATKFEMAFLLDHLSVVMATIVLFISLMVHIYTIGYMAEDPGYARFFSYVSLFTFAMLLLVFANNFLLMFFGWEGVGLVSYLLIGFWFKRESAVAGSLKAFLVNRIGDIGFIIGTAAVFAYFGSLNYHTVFQMVPEVVNKSVNIFPTYQISVLTFICAALFIGAMGKSAQVPLHVWLPESMEGPTPISALIHAATMVTAGIYMVARLSPLFEYAPAVLNAILIIGGITAFFMGLLAIVQYDIKRVIAYSTLSQLGYMAVALGASAYEAAIFHLVTHAFFKALLFLAAGSVIIALHHEQDMRKMGGLASYLPVTYLTFVIGALALCAVPPFSGFYSKDIIIEAVRLSTLPAASFAYYCVLAGTFVTALYTFRALFMTFHTHERMDPQILPHIKESPWVVLFPLIALAIPSIVSGQLLIDHFLFSQNKWLAGSIFVLPQHDVLAQLAAEYQGAKLMALEAGTHLTFWLVMAGIFVAWLYICAFPQWATALKKRFALFYRILLAKYGFDTFNQKVVVEGTKDTGQLLYQVSDVKMIDEVCVNGSGRFINWLAKTLRLVQTGYVYDYAMAMVLGVLVMLAWYMGGW